MAEVATTPRIVLKPGLESFNRSVRDKKGKIVRTINFRPAAPLDLSDVECEAVANDIGNVLLLCQFHEDGSFRIDREMTNEVVLNIAVEKLEAKKELTPVQRKAIELAEEAELAVENEKSRQIEEEKILADNPMLALNLQIDELEDATEKLIESIENASDEDATEIRNQIEANEESLKKLHEELRELETEELEEAIRGFESELECFEAVLNDEKASDEDKAKAKTSASTFKGKITKARNRIAELAK